MDKIRRPLATSPMARLEFTAPLLTGPDAAATDTTTTATMEG